MRVVSLPSWVRGKLEIQGWGFRDLHVTSFARPPSFWYSVYTLEARRSYVTFTRGMRWVWSGSHGDLLFGVEHSETSGQGS